MTIRLFPITAAVVLIFGALACNAPRTNPVDPANPDGSIHYLDGTVASDTRTPVPLADVTVSWLGTTSRINTDAAGRFTLALSQPGDGWLCFGKSGYVADSIRVEWAGRRVVAVRQYLHALPVPESFTVATFVRNKYSGADHGLEINAVLLDEYDIDSVFLQQDDLGIRQALTRITATTFRGAFLDYELGLSSLNQVIGKPFTILVREQAGAYHTVGTSYATRIIDQEIETVAPKNSDTVFTAAPGLRWKRFAPGFAFTYRLEVYTNEPEPKLQWSRTALSSDSITVTVSPALTVTETSNEFFWVIWCIDEFNNANRSKPASFICGMPDSTRIVP